MLSSSLLIDALILVCRAASAGPSGTSPSFTLNTFRTVNDTGRAEAGSLQTGRVNIYAMLSGANLYRLSRGLPVPMPTRFPGPGPRPSIITSLIDRKQTGSAHLNLGAVRRDHIQRYKFAFELVICHCCVSRARVHVAYRPAQIGASCYIERSSRMCKYSELGSIRHEVDHRKR